jgi:hypothetical protein
MFVSDSRKEKAGLVVDTMKNGPVAWQEPRGVNPFKKLVTIHKVEMDRLIRRMGDSSTWTEWPTQFQFQFGGLSIYRHCGQRMVVFYVFNRSRQGGFDAPPSRRARGICRRCGEISKAYMVLRKKLHQDEDQ